MGWDEATLRRELVAFGERLYAKDYIGSVDGNLSVRLGPDRIMVTPSGIHKGFMRPEQMVVVNGAGEPVWGELRPTSELPMHLEVYRQRPDVSAVIHAHPPKAVTLTIAGLDVADGLIPELIVLLGFVPVTPYATPSSEENADAIRQAIRDKDALMLARHGSLTVGRDLWQAFNRLETVERSAEIALNLALLGVRNPLPAAQLEKLLAQRDALGLLRPGERDELLARLTRPTKQHIEWE
jgi:L-fuculose-phosphate aldolase